MNFMEGKFRDLIFELKYPINIFSKIPSLENLFPNFLKQVQKISGYYMLCYILAWKMPHYLFMRNSLWTNNNIQAAFGRELRATNAMTKNDAKKGTRKDIYLGNNVQLLALLLHFMPLLVSLSANLPCSGQSQASCSCS